jgi:hypothetical protein
MKSHTNPKEKAALMPPPNQSKLQLESAEIGQRIPEERRTECIALLRELIEAVGAPKPQPGGSHE